MDGFHRLSVKFPLAAYTELLPLKPLLPIMLPDLEGECGDESGEGLPLQLCPPLPAEHYSRVRQEPEARFRAHPIPRLLLA